jgi:putative FmdB family regulatory protein
MPIYEYRCQSCGAVSEFLVGRGDDEKVRCKVCGEAEADLHRILSAASFTVQSPGHRPGHTCCGREERCATPPCSDAKTCRRV